MPTRPAEDIEVTLFRQILMVPFAIEAADGGALEAKALRGELAEQLSADAERRWERLPEPLFHLPEDRIPDDLDREQRARLLAPAYEEFVYFEPYVQDFLFGSANEPAPLEIWRSTALHEATIDIDHDLGEPPPDTSPVDDQAPRVSSFRFAVDRCNLYAFPTGNALLAIELRLMGRLRAGVMEPASLDHTLRLLESTRRMFPPFFVAEGSRHGDPGAPLDARYFVRAWRALDRSGQPLWQGTFEVDATSTIETVVGRDGARASKVTPLFEPWRHLLQPLGIKGLAREHGSAVVLAQLGDDRAFVLAQIGVRDPHEISPGDWVRLCFLDTPGDGLPYGRDFLADFERQHCYDRFFSKTPHDGQTTRYLACGHAMVVVGRTPAECESGYSGCFFRHVLGKHVRRQYFDLILIALLQKTALKTLSDRIASIDAGDPKAVIAMQHAVLDFTHRYWFEDISAQMQAQDLFELLRRHLRLRPLYDQIAQESREANALAAQEASRREQEKQGRLADAAQSLNVIAAVGLAASVIVGFFGMNVFKEAPFMRADRDFVLGLSLLMAGGFATLFLWRDSLVNWFAANCAARFALPFIALVVGGLFFFVRLAGQ